MKEPIKIKTDPKVVAKFAAYPEAIRPKMQALRTLIVETASEIENNTTLDEMLKWNEPSYLTKKGSTLRIDWKAKKPNQYAIYFKCTSKLVPTFKILFKDSFSFEGNRAIIFQKEEDLPIPKLKACIAAALQYHLVKHLPNLGIKKTI